MENKLSEEEQSPDDFHAFLIQRGKDQKKGNGVKKDKDEIWVFHQCVVLLVVSLGAKINLFELS